MDTEASSAEYTGQKGTRDAIRILSRFTILTAFLLACILLAKQGRDMKSIASQILALSLLPFLVLHARGLIAGALSHKMYPIACWLIALAAFFVSDPAYSARELIRQSLLISFLAATQVAFEPRDLRRLVTLWVILIIPVCGYALLQRFGIEPIEEFSSWASHERVFSTFGNPDFLGAHLAMLLPLSAAFAVELSRPARRSLALALPASAALILLWTGSRGAWLGAGVGIGTWALLRYSWIRLRRKLPHVLIFTSITAAILVMSGQLKPEAFSRHTDRPLLWRGALLMLRQAPIFGYGPGSFPANYPDYAPIPFAARMRADNTFAEHAHCEYLNIAVETGIVGLGLFLWLLATIIRLAFRMTAFRGLWPAVPGALLAALVHAAFDRNFRLASTSVPFWVLSGLLFSRPGIFRISVSRAHYCTTYAGFAAVIILSLLASAYLLRPLQSSYRVAAEPDFMDIDPLQSSSELELSRANQEKGPIYFMELGNTQAREGNFEGAINSYLMALRLEPGLAAAANNLGNAYFMLSKFDQAIPAYRRALDMEPKNTDARFNLAFAYYHKRQIKEAVEECHKIIKLDPYNHKALQLLENLRP